MTDKLFVHCFQPIKGQKVPFIAEFVKDGAQQCVIRVGKTEHKVHRGACSSDPFTQRQLDEMKLAVAPKPKKERAVGTKTDSKSKPVKVEGSFW